MQMEVQWSAQNDWQDVREIKAGIPEVSHWWLLDVSDVTEGVSVESIKWRQGLKVENTWAVS